VNTLPNISNKSVEWLDHPVSIDRSFLDEVPLVPEKLLQGISEPLMGSYVDHLFGQNQPNPFASFPNFDGYRNSLKRLFTNKVLATFDIEIAKETLDNFFELEGDDLIEDGEKLYHMLEELSHLNVILEQIYLNILSILKP
jgi:hypothetical protein